MLTKQDFVLDLDVFFSDFKQNICLDGKVVEAVIEFVEAKEWGSNPAERAEVDVHVRTADVPATTARQPGGVVIIDGRRFVVVRRSDDFGLTTFGLCMARGY